MPNNLLVSLLEIERVNTDVDAYGFGIGIPSYRYMFDVDGTDPRTILI